MMNQYKKETSQIHAPADLVQRTKLAMQQEEQRLRECAEKAERSDIAARKQTGAAAGNTKQNIKSVSRIYRWAYPLTAAAAILILISVSTVMRSSKLGSSDSDRIADSGYEKDAGLQFGETDRMEEGMEENKVPIGDTPAKPIRKDTAEDYADYDMAESAEDAVSAEDTIPTEAEEAASDIEPDYSASAEKMEETAGTNGEMNGEEASEQEISIAECETMPDFYYSPDTEGYLYEELLFWANQYENGDWFAYVNVRGDKYVIVSKMKDQDEFLEKAYELVIETRGSVE